MLFKGHAKKLRICSLGCGNGSLDKLILHEILQKYPKISIEFVGIEINEVVYDEAQKQLLLPGCNVKVTLYNQDFMVDIPEESFDVLLAVHSLYYIESCLEGITRLRKMMTKTGLFILSANFKYIKCDCAVKDPGGVPKTILWLI